jgi:hypothetical protein
MPQPMLRAFSHDVSEGAPAQQNGVLSMLFPGIVQSWQKTSKPDAPFCRRR